MIDFLDLIVTLTMLNDIGIFGFILIEPLRETGTKENLGLEKEYLNLLSSTLFSIMRWLGLAKMKGRITRRNGLLRISKPQSYSLS